jgi:hypothetical protein
MVRIITHLIFFLFTGLAAFSQVRVVKPAKTHPKSTNIGIGGGLTSSMLFLAQNVKENNSAMGYNATITYGGSKSNLRGTLEYTQFKRIDIAPTWYNIHASTIEANLHIIARFKNIKAYFYPIIGISYNVFSGYFTGINDFLHLRNFYKTDDIATKKWLGLNVGTGYEVYFKRVSLFVDYKMRVGTAAGSKQLNIMDVCLFGGLRYNLKVPSIYSIFKGTRSRYVLDKEDSR